MRRCCDEEDGGDDSGGIATGTQKRGSKQGEALTSACFTFERDRERRRRGKKRKRSREQEDRQEIEKQDKRKKQDKQQGRRAQGEAMRKMPRWDFRQMQFNSTATGRQQSTGSHTHKAAGCSQTAAARGYYCAAQAASNSPQVFPIIRLHPKTQIPQRHWLQRENDCQMMENGSK